MEGGYGDGIACMHEVPHFGWIQGSFALASRID